MQTPCQGEQSGVFRGSGESEDYLEAFLACVFRRNSSLVRHWERTEKRCGQHFRQAVSGVFLEQKCLGRNLGAVVRASLMWLLSYRGDWNIYHLS